MKQNTDSSSFSLLPDAGGYDPIEDRLRANVRATIEAMFEEELADFLGRLRYGRGNARAGKQALHRLRRLGRAVFLGRAAALGQQKGRGQRQASNAREGQRARISLGHRDVSPGVRRVNLSPAGAPKGTTRG